MKLFPALLLRFRPGFIPPAPLNSKIGKYSKDFANLPERFVFRKSRKLVYKAEDHPAYKPMIQFKTATQHYLERPWTSQYWAKSLSDKKVHGLFVEPIKEEDWMWFRGDRVEVITGEDKGKQGIIKIVVQERNWIYVDGLNLTYEISGEEANFPGMMISKEKPLLVTTDIKLVDPSDEQAADFEWRFNENGERVRVSVRSGYQLPMPTVASETVDYKSRAGYVENKTKDTPAKDVEEITYIPKPCTFDMDVMNVMGIVENRKPTRTYWY